jgi:hypothetical protein
MSVFSGLFDNLFSGLIGDKGNLGDYRHATRLYIDNNMRLAPKFKFLYHVVFNINPLIRTLFPLVNQIPRNEINLLCKSADMPKYNMQTTTINQYNRKKVVQTGIQYQPISIEFHDDNAGLTTLLWECYYRYYIADGNYTARQVDGSPAISVREYNRASNGINSAYANQGFNLNKFGLDRPNKPVDFFTSIQIFQLHPRNAQPTYTSFTIINPKIDQFQHDRLDQSVSEFTLNSMSLSYETVLYNRGVVRRGNAPTGFGETHYDQIPSPLKIDQAFRNPDARTTLGREGTISGINNSNADLQEGNRSTVLERTINLYQSIDVNLPFAKTPITQTSVESNSIDNIVIPSTTISKKITNATPKQF